jgi:hypothetical protein
MIYTFKELLVNETFIKLAKLQSLCDEADPAMVEHAFSRSPYHVMAFLVAYAAATEAQRSQITAKLNSINAEMRFDKSELLRLISQVDWSTLLKKSIVELNPIDLTFSIVVSIGLTTTIHTSNRKAFFDAVARNFPPLSEALRAADSSIEIVESPDKNVLTFLTRIEESHKWKKPFEQYEGNCFTVEHFKISDSLSHLINTMEEGAALSVGCFRVNKGIGVDKRHLKLRIKVPHASVKEDTFCLKLNQKLKTNPGIYNAFLGMEDYCGLPLVGDIRVRLESMGGFTEAGAGVMQTQYLDMLLCVESAKVTILTVENLDGTFFLDSAIAVRFTEGPAATTKTGILPQYYIDLETKERTPVRLFPEALGPQQALSAAIEYIEPAHPMLRKSVSPMAQAWQGTAAAGSAAPHGGAGASSSDDSQCHIM